MIVNKYLRLVTSIFFLILALPAKSDTLYKIGKDVFLNKAICSSCHILADANSKGQIGPNLNEIRADKSRIIIAVTNGIGVMPAYEGQLTTEEIEAVAHYVFESTN